MSKEKTIKLTKYANDLKSRLSDKNVPLKQANRVKEYRQFLERELETVNSQIETLKTSNTADLSKK